MCVPHFAIKRDPHGLLPYWLKCRLQAACFSLCFSCLLSHSGLLLGSLSQYYTDMFSHLSNEISSAGPANIAAPREGGGPLPGVTSAPSVMSVPSLPGLALSEGPSCYRPTPRRFPYPLCRPRCNWVMQGGRRPCQGWGISLSWLQWKLTSKEVWQEACFCVFYVLCRNVTWITVSGTSILVSGRSCCADCTMGASCQLTTLLASYGSGEG